MSTLIDANNIANLKEYIVNLLYPVGSRYVQLQGMPEPSTLGGTWELDSNYNNKALWCNNSLVLGTDLAGSLPNIEGTFTTGLYNRGGQTPTGAFTKASDGSWNTVSEQQANKGTRYNFTASNSNTIYSALAGENVVRPTSMTCKVWKRTA